MDIRQLMPARIFNLLVNPFAVMGLQANLQKDIFRRGGALPYGDMEGGAPIWLYTDLSVGALKASRGHFPLPLNFYLLSMMASASVNTVGGFRGVLYDTTRRLPLTMRPCNTQTLAGVGSSPLFAGLPYHVDDQAREPKIKFQIFNLENATNLIQLVLHGVQTPN